MTTIQFYHLTATPLERALPKLLEKALAAKFKIVVVADSDERVEQLNQSLWTYHPGSFLPHGSAKDGHVEKQPIFLSTHIKTPNQANLLAVTNGAQPEKPEQFERILDIFDGNDVQAVAKARTRWKSYKDLGHSISYLRQNETGGWEQKAA